MNERLTFEWIVKMLRISGHNTKQIVADRLENATSEELGTLIEDLYDQMNKRCDDEAKAIKRKWRERKWKIF